MSKLLVGAGKSCINPAPEMFPIPTSQKDWGRAVSPQAAVYDDMNCRAIAIDNGMDKLLILSFEMSFPPSVDDIYGDVAKATGFPRECILCTATHNHTAPHDTAMLTTKNNSQAEEDFRAAFRQIEVEGAIEAAKQAIASMRPAKYGYGESLSYINVNRDLETPDGRWVEARNMEGFSDHTLAIIKFVDMEGNLIAAFMNHPTHATNCYMMRDADGIRKTSGNFTGIAAKFVEQHYGNGAVALWTSGAAGNQNPLLSHGMQWEYPDGFTTAVEYPDGVGYMQMEFMGRWHGSDCVKGIDAITRYSENMPIKHLNSIIDLPSQKYIPTPGVERPFRMSAFGVRDFEKYPYGTLPPYPKLPVMEDDPENPAKLRMSLIILGDIALVGVNAEIYNEIGAAMKEASPYRKTVVVTHTNKDKVSYIMDKSTAERGAKVFQAYNLVKPGVCDELIVNGMLDMFKDSLK